VDVAVVRSPLFLGHAAPDEHPERPERLSAILELFHEAPRFRDLPAIEPRAAEPSLLRKVHAAALLQQLEAIRGKSGWIDPDTYYNPKSADLALRAAGATADLAAKIWSGEYRRGFSLVRPPGHHATPTRSMGFCLLNNAALAVAAVREAKPDARIAVVDFDLHHGNGTQDAFYRDPDLLFVSSHRYPFYPGTGALIEVGEGSGKGTTVNFPLDSRYGDDLFLSLYGSLVVPMLRAFRPDMMVVSAGFDGHARDPMYGFRIHSPTFRKLTEQLCAAAEATTGKILFVLEGGYEPLALKESVAGVLDALIEFPRAATPLERVPDADDQALVERFRDHYQPYFPEL
jgi:acetoin utilization deacetylase AcuC-like enzyme